MPDTATAKPKRTLVRRLQALGATWDDPRWIVPTAQRPALVALLLDAGYNVEQADQADQAA